jgi:hypothetical protein
VRTGREHRGTIEVGTARRTAQCYTDFEEFGVIFNQKLLTPRPPRCDLRIFIHRRGTERAEFGEIFTRRPQRLRGEPSVTFVRWVSHLHLALPIGGYS